MDAFDTKSKSKILDKDISFRASVTSARKPGGNGTIYGLSTKADEQIIKSKKLLNAAGQQQVKLEPNEVPGYQFTRFATPKTMRVCNSSSREVYRSPKFVNDRTSQSETIPSKGTPC